MPLKPRHKRRITWSLISCFGLFLLGLIVIPPMVHLNYLKPKIEKAIFTETGIKAAIHGNINFSLLGKATIVAHNITLPNGFVSSCKFSIPLSDIFNLEKADISKDIVVNGASVNIDKILPFTMNNHLIVNDSKFHFLNKDYDIINASFSKETVKAFIRTNQHKYEITSINNNFIIKNKNNNLNLYGKLLNNGTATAHISIIAKDVNKWFEFDVPRIKGKFPITANIKWDGGYGIDFYNISANGVSGEANLLPNGYKKIKLQSKTADYDMSFVIKHPYILKNTEFDMDFYGKIKFLDKNFKHLYINTVGEENNIGIQKIIADNLIITGGNINKQGAHDLMISLYDEKTPVKCLFNGTPNNWSCNQFSYGNDISGVIVSENNFIKADIKSNNKNPDIQTLVNSANKLADFGIINFQFKDSAGIIKFTGNKYSITYDYAKNKTLEWAGTDLHFLPKSMLSAKGDFIRQNDTMMFTPYSQDWSVATNKDNFYIMGNNFKLWFPDIDLQSMRDLPYFISGNYKNGNIANLIIETAQQKFTGSVAGKSITLKTDLLNLDAFVSQNFLDNYEELSFFTVAPITIPFDLDINISLSADVLIYNGHKYNNFVYALKPNLQTFSITDSNRGNILTTIKKRNNSYTINIQLNKFVMNNKLLPNNMPLNILDSTITAEINLKTSGKIAHDIFDNINGVFDLSFEGGNLYGLGLADFYAATKDITILNAEYILSNALEQGITPIKKMRIIGIYDKGNIQTTKPISLSVKYSDITGNLQITDNKMTADLQLILRGTSPVQTPIGLTIYPNNKREYSLSEIMISFDPEYMRTFIQSHDRF